MTRKRLLASLECGGVPCAVWAAPPYSFLPCPRVPGAREVLALAALVDYSGC